MSIEVELKLTVNSRWTAELAASLLAELHSFASACRPGKTGALLNVYYDTEHAWFRQQDAGLRTRLRAGQYEQTIKLAGQQHGAAHIRPEYNLPCATVVPELTAFPAEIWPPLTDVAALQQQIQEMFRTDFVRTAWILTLSDQTELEVVFDQGQVMAGDLVEPILEIELELLHGDGQALFQLAQRLLQLFPVQLGFQSKAERGYRLAQQQPLTVLTLDQEATLSQCLRAVVQNSFLQQITPNTATTALLTTQLQQLAQRLHELSADPDLLTSMPTDADLPSPALSSWLLAVSAWLYQQQQGR